MQQVSKEYKRYIQDEIFLNTDYATSIYLGAVNQKAQAHASVMEGHFHYLSNKEVFAENRVQDYYASCERNGITLDTNYVFTPAKESKFQGLISSQISNATGVINYAVTVEIEKAMQVKGFTIQFEQSIISDFKFVDDKGKVLYEVVGNKELKYTSYEVFDFTKQFRIVFTKTQDPYKRIQISNIIFGLELWFETKDIQSASIKETASLLSTELPTIDLSFSILNTDSVYDIDNPKSFINFFEKNQEVEVYTSITLPSGTTERILISTLRLREWSADRDLANFTACDIFQDVDMQYDNATFEKTTLYDLAETVLSRMNIENNSYLIDSSLKDIQCIDQLPITSCANALQLIANAGMCRIWQDRYMNTYILSILKKPEVESYSYTNPTDMSTYDIIDNKEYRVYATASNGVIQMDNNFLFLTSKQKTNVGYVSNVSDGKGNFSVDSSISFYFETAVDLHNVNLEFGYDSCKELKIQTSREGQAVEELLITSQKNTAFNYNFKVCDKMVIQFLNTKKPYQRIQLASIHFSNVTDKVIRGDFMENTVVSKAERVSDLIIYYTNYNAEVEEHTIEEFDIALVKGQVFNDEITVNTPHDRFHVYVDDVHIKTIDTKGYKVKYSLSDIECGVGNHAIRVTGNELKETKSSITFNLAETGVIKELDNPLVETREHATKIAEWVENYLYSEKEYSFKTRGDASLDCADLVKQENKYNTDLTTIILSHELTLGAVLSSTLLTREVKE